MTDAAPPDAASKPLSAPPRAAAPGDKPARIHLRPATSERGKGTPRKTTGGLSATAIAALALTFVWLGLIGWFFLTRPETQRPVTLADPVGLMTVVMGVFLPVALIWVAAFSARTARKTREECARLRKALDTMRDGHAAGQQAETTALRRDLDARLEQVSNAQAILSAEIAALQAPTKPAAVLSAPVRPAPAAPLQPTLSLGAEPDAEPLPPEDFIRALNFPENERDLEGFDILRRALTHHDTARLVTAAQDLLTLLAQDGIFMDDLTVHRADAVLWRAFADGTNGSDVAALGGIRDRSSIALTAGRMKEDTVFRDAVHHFLRTFDQVFAGFSRIATDGEIMAFANTRTARAFMLCARVAGTFD